jgi:hypothetical protein
MDISAAAYAARQQLFDYLVGAGEQLCRQIDAESPFLQVDD